MAVHSEMKVAYDDIKVNIKVIWWAT